MDHFLPGIFATFCSHTITAANYEEPGVIDPNGEVLTGPFGHIPTWTAFVSAAYRLDLSDGSDIRFNLNARDKDERVSDEGTAEAVIPGDLVIGANATWTSSDDRFTLGLWGRNLTNEDDIASVVAPTALSINNGVVQAGAPRTYGVTFRVRS